MSESTIQGSNYQYTILLGLREDIEKYGRGGRIWVKQVTEYAKICIYETTLTDPPQRVKDRYLIERTRDEPFYIRIHYLFRDEARVYGFHWDPERRLWYTSGKYIPMYFLGLQVIFDTRQPRGLKASRQGVLQTKAEPALKRPKVRDSSDTAGESPEPGRRTVS